MPRTCLKYFLITLIMGGGVSASEFMWGIVKKNKWKITKGLQKSGIFFSLNTPPVRKALGIRMVKY